MVSPKKAGLYEDRNAEHERETFRLTSEQLWGHGHMKLTLQR
jgi:hypothetical protein